MVLPTLSTGLWRCALQTVFALLMCVEFWVLSHSPAQQDRDRAAHQNRQRTVVYAMYGIRAVGLSRVLLPTMYAITCVARVVLRGGGS